MTNPMSPGDPDTILAAWLEEGPAQLPESTRRAIAVGLRSTRQNRRVLDVPWRPNAMNPFARLAIAAAVIVIVAGGALYLFTPGNQGVGGPPTADPSPSAVVPSAGPSVPPSASTTTPVAWETFTSDRFGYRIEVPSGWTHGAPTDDLPDELYPGDEGELGDRWDPPVMRAPWLIVSVLDPAPAETPDEWLTRNFTLLEQFCDASEPTDVVVGGEPGTRRTILCPAGLAGDLVLFVHEGRIFGIEMGGAPRDAETMAGILDHALGTFAFTGPS